jgi:hypothetical protein
MKGKRDRQMREEMVVQMREEMVVKPLEGGIEDFVEPICSLLEAAENFVDMSTSLYPDFYNKDELKDAIKTCVKKVIKFRILLMHLKKKYRGFLIYRTNIQIHSK